MNHPTVSKVSHDVTYSSPGQGVREARATHEAFVSQSRLQAAPPVPTGQAGGPEALILGSGDAKSEDLSGDEDEGDTSGGCTECFESVWCYES